MVSRFNPLQVLNERDRQRTDERSREKEREIDRSRDTERGSFERERDGVCSEENMGETA
jgi:hypothetical protein